MENADAINIDIGTTGAQGEDKPMGIAISQIQSGRLKDLIVPNPRVDIAIGGNGESAINSGCAATAGIVDGEKCTSRSGAKDKFSAN